MTITVRMSDRTYEYPSIPVVQRMMALVDIGLSDRAVAAVMNLDFGTSFTRDSIRHHRKRAGIPSRVKPTGRRFGQ